MEARARLRARDFVGAELAAGVCFLFRESCVLLPASCFLRSAPCYLLPASSIHRVRVCRSSPIRLRGMSENARRKSVPESHLIEQQLADAPVRSWAGFVRITTEAGTFSVPGTWHLDLPHESRALQPHPRVALPLPDVTDLDAWREHLLRVVSLQLPGSRLRVRETAAGTWRSLEIAAPTVPRSVVQIDRDGWARLMGGSARMEMRVSGGTADGGTA